MLVIEALLLLGIWKPSHVITVIFVYNASLMGRMPVLVKHQVIEIAVMLESEKSG